MIRIVCVAFLLVALPATAVGQSPKPGAVPVERKAGVDPLGDPLPWGAGRRFGTARLRHTGEVLLGFTPDGRQLASVGADQTFYLWAADSGKERRHYTNSSIALHSATGQIIHLGGGGQQVVWHRHGGGMPSMSIAFAPSGQWLACLLDSKTAAVWDTASGKESRRFTFKYDGGHALAFSGDGKLFAAGDFGEEQVVRIWDRASGQEVRKLKGVSPVTRLLFSPGNHYLAAVESNNTPQVRLWHVPSGKRLRTYQGHTHWITGLSFSPDGKRLATVAGDGLRVWETDSEEEIAKLAAVGNAQFTAVAFSPDGHTLASGSYDGVVRLWDVATLTENHTLKGHSGSVNSISWSPDGRTLATASARGTIRLWNVATGKESALPRLAGGVRAVGFGKAGALVLTTEDGSATVRTLGSGRLERHLDKPAVKGALMGISPDGQFQTWWDENSQFVVWCRARSAPAWKPSTAVVGSAFSPDGRFLALAGPDEVVTMWRLDTGKEVRRLEKAGTVGLLAFSPNGRTLATVNGQKGELSLWELSSGQLQARFACPWNTLTCLAFSADGQTLAAGSSDETVRVWDTLSGRLLRGLLGHRGAVNAVAFDPRDRWLVSGGEDGTVRVWDTATGAEYRCFAGHRGGVQSVAFAPDGRHLVSGGKDTTALVWDLETPAAPLPQGGAAKRELEPLWTALGHTDAAVAYAALRDLLARRDEVMPLLRERLRPVPRVKEEDVAALIAALDQKQHAVRERATRDLEKLEGQALPAVRKARDAKPAPEVAKRLDALLAKLEAALTDPPSLRSLRAVQLLERFGTPAACELLHALAQGAPGARLTRDAQEAWQRLSQRQRRTQSTAGTARAP